LTKKPSEKKKTGRPGKLTKRLQNRICKLIELGNYPEVAAQHEGIGKTTYYKWMEWGQSQPSKEGGLYRKFREAIKRSRAKKAAKYLAAILRAVPDHWQAAAWVLERSERDHWAKKEGQAEGFSADELMEFVAAVIGVINSTVKSKKDRAAIKTKLQKAADALAKKKARRK
jgi:hypothetical protein